MAKEKHEKISDDDIFNSIYSRYINLMYAIARKRIQNENDIEDCLQDVFLYLLKHTENIEMVNSQETKNYIATITNGFAITYYHRQMKAAAKSVPLDVLPDNLSTFSIMESWELSDAIQNLSDMDRVLIYLTYIYGYTSSEIGDMYNLKASVVRKRLQNIRRVLKGVLA